VAVLVAGCWGGSGGNGNAFPGVQGPRNDYRGVVVVDFDADGLTDLVAARQRIDPKGPDPSAIEVFRRDAADPSRFRAPVAYHMPCSPYTVNVVDLDGAEGVDVVTSCTFAEAGVRVLLGAAGGGLDAGTFLAAPEALYETAAADIDLDGLADIVAAGDAALYVFLQRTADPGTFAPPVNLGVGSQRVEVVDVDADDFVDLVAPSRVSTAAEQLVVHRQDPNVPGTFMPPISLDADHSIGDVAAADLDGDGAVDIASAGFGGGIGTFRGAWTLFVGDAMQPAGFRLAGDWPLGESIRTLVDLADLEGDGDVDVVLGRRTAAANPNVIDVFLTDGAPSALDASYVIPDDRAATVPELHEVGLADVDGDARVDVVVSTNEIFYFPQRADAAGRFGAAVRIAAQR
jgi:hypothetical protein